MAAWRTNLSAHCRTLFLVIVTTYSGALGQAPTPEPYDDPLTPEGWAWATIKQGKDVDFNDRCNTTTLNSRASESDLWKQDCRRISGAFLVDLLTRESLRKLVPFAGIKIIGARIDGDINLQNAQFDRAIFIYGSFIEGDINLAGARAESIVAFVDSSIAGKFDALQFYGKLSLDLSSAEVTGQLLLDDAKIDGNVSTENATFRSEINAVSIQVGGNLSFRSANHDNEVFLSGAKVAGNVYMDGAVFHGNINADSMAVGASLSMRTTQFKGLTLSNARITGSVQLDGASFSGSLRADALEVGVSLFMRSAPQHGPSRFKDISLNSARINRNVDMDGARVAGDVNAHLLWVGGSLVMRSVLHDGWFTLIGARVGDNLEANGSSFKGMTLSGAHVVRNMLLEGVTFDYDLEAIALQVGSSLSMKRSTAGNTRIKGLDLSSAKVNGDLHLDDAILDGSEKADIGSLKADALQVGGSLTMRNVVGNQITKINFGQIGGNLDIRGATLAELDLSGSTIVGDFRLSGPKGEYKNTFWHIPNNEFGHLRLRNTRITNLMDAEDAWPAPEHLELGGFRFAHLGGFAGDDGLERRSRNGDRSGTEGEMVRRRMTWWDKWARRDPIYSPAPYEQLAAALIASGNREDADEIRYLGRVRQRETENWGSWIFSGFLQYVAGFGIGDRTFRVLYWVLAIIAAGAIYLMKCVPAARKRGVVWCFGASFSRLLPMIELNKEFTEFFHDPKRTRLTDWQVFVFSAIGIAGWLLGAILVAAVSGLTQKP
jgi:hypothetical protein